ncbi:MAG TPA: hypothetical protein VKH44_01055 [Pirellulaceae bacterium]|nr:hypothetical protein [Pirellulaceae bacterium]
MPSSIRPTREGPAGIRVAPAEVTIVDWPLRDRPVGSSLALSLAAGASWLAVWATENAAAGGVVAALLAVTLWRTWLPVQYQLGADGVTQSVLGWRRRLAWTAIWHVDTRSDGVVLLPDATPTPLGPLRGVYLHWGGQREAVMANLDFYLLGRREPAIGSTHGRAAAVEKSP